MKLLPPPAPGATPVDLPAPHRWRIEWRGNTYLETDLRGEHLAVLGLLHGDDNWENLDITAHDPLKGPVRLMMMIVAFHAVAHQMSDAAGVASIVADVSSSPAEEILAALHFD